MGDSSPPLPMLNIPPPPTPAPGVVAPVGVPGADAAVGAAPNPPNAGGAPPAAAAPNWNGEPPDVEGCAAVEAPKLKPVEGAAAVGDAAPKGDAEPLARLVTNGKKRGQRRAATLSVPRKLTQAPTWSATWRVHRTGLSSGVQHSSRRKRNPCWQVQLTAPQTAMDLSCAQNDTSLSDLTERARAQVTHLAPNAGVEPNAKGDEAAGAVLAGAPNVKPPEATAGDCGAGEGEGEKPPKVGVAAPPPKLGAGLAAVDAGAGEPPNENGVGDASFLAGCPKLNDDDGAPNAGVLDVPEGEFSEKLKGAAEAVATGDLTADSSSAPPSSIPLSSSADSIGGTEDAVGLPNENVKLGLPSDATGAAGLAAVDPKLKGDDVDGPAEKGVGAAGVFTAVAPKENGDAAEAAGAGAADAGALGLKLNGDAPLAAGATSVFCGISVDVRKSDGSAHSSRDSPTRSRAWRRRAPPRRCCHSCFRIRIQKRMEQAWEQAQTLLSTARPSFPPLPLSRWRSRACRLTRTGWKLVLMAALKTHLQQQERPAWTQSH